MKRKPTASMMRSRCSHEAKRTLPSPCAEGTLHSRRLLHELLRNSLHAPKVRFIEKSTCFRKCFFLCSSNNFEPLFKLLQKVLQFKTTAQPSLKPLYPQKHFFNRRRYLNDFLTPTDISGWISQKFSAKLRLMSS